MVTTRRSFIRKTAFSIAGIGFSKLADANNNPVNFAFPIVISTLKIGMSINDTAWKILSEGGYSLDAVEEGIRAAEVDSDLTELGYVRFPDNRGKVTLDASIMNERGDAGSVAFLQCIKHPVSVARLVMENTSHVMLSGKGAQRFALENGFKKEKLLTKEMRKEWLKQKKNAKESSSITDVESQLIQNPGTISMLAIDEKGRLCGAISSGSPSFKIHGRVGDSSVVGAGLYVHGEAGGAVAAGTGELLMKTMGCFLVVEFMRNGMSPEEACNSAIARIVKEITGSENHQVGFIAISKTGEIGAASIHPGFKYSVKTKSVSEWKEAGAWFKKL